MSTDLAASPTSAHARTEFRTETCGECGWTIERELLVSSVAASSPVPAGWTLRKRTGAWKTITRRSRFTTLCGCDT